MVYESDGNSKTNYVSVNTLIQPKKTTGRSFIPSQKPIQKGTGATGLSQDGPQSKVQLDQNSPKDGSGTPEQKVSQGLSEGAWVIEKIPAISLVPVPGFEFMQNFFKGMLVGSLERLSQEKIEQLWTVIQNVAKAVTSKDYMIAYFWGFLRGFFGDFIMIGELPGTIKKTVDFVNDLLARVKGLSQGDLLEFQNRIEEIKASITEDASAYIHGILEDIKAGKSSELLIEILKILPNLTQDAGKTVGNRLTGVMLAYFSKDTKELGKDLGGTMGELSGTVAFTAILAGITAGIGVAWGGVRAGIKTVTETIGKGIAKAVKEIGTVCKSLSKVFETFINGARAVMKGFGSGASKLFKGIKGKIDELLVKVKRLIDDILERLGRKNLITGNNFTYEKAKRKIPKGFFEDIPGKKVKEVKDEVTEKTERLVARGTSDFIDSKTVDEILALEKGLRPAPSTYLSKEYIDKHLAMFDGGVTKIQSRAPTRPLGPPSGTFIMPKSVADELIAEAGGKVSKLEQLLSLEPGTLGSSPVRIDISKPTGLRIPDGNEVGANSQWIPGGYTAGGIPEATIDQVPLDKLIVTKLFN